MLFGSSDSSYDVVKEGEDTVLRIDYENAMEVPSLEDSEQCMADTIEKLIANRNITKIIFSQKRDYEYDYAQTRILVEFSKTYSNMLKHKAVFNYSVVSMNEQQPIIMNSATQKYAELQNVIFNLLKKESCWRIC